MADALITLRRELHRHPELSGRESETGRRIREFFQPLNADRTITALGGHGIAFVFSGGRPGPTVMLRAELDGLPIRETNQMAYRSTVDGVGHTCGHDGHMSILCGVGVTLAERRPERGRVVLLFQPAEETGAGAAAVIRDEKFVSIAPDFAFALHNLPGFPMGEIMVRAGPMNCASRGVVIDLEGREAHAAQPESGVSPSRAMCGIIESLENMSSQSDEMAFTTVVGAKLGEKAFGTAPGSATIMATLRSETDATIEQLSADVQRIVSAHAKRYGLQYGIAYEDVFPATLNSPRAVEILRRAVGDCPFRAIPGPFPWSEDFGHFTARCDGALFGLGAGEDAAQLHSPAYDFPDGLIDTGVGLFQRVVAECLILPS